MKNLSEPNSPLEGETPDEAAKSAAPDDLLAPWPVPDLAALAEAEREAIAAAIQAGKESEARIFAALEAAGKETQAAAPDALLDFKTARRAELRRQRDARDAYTPDVQSEVYDGPLDEFAEPLPSCLRRWEAAKAARVWDVLERRAPGESGETQSAQSHVLLPHFAARFGVREGDVFAQFEEGRAAYFRAALPAQIIEAGTLCRFELTWANGKIEHYIGAMIEAGEWKEVQTLIVKKGAALRVVGVAVAIIACALDPQEEGGAE